MKKVDNSDNISLHYKGTLTNGEMFDSSEGRDPLKFEVGAGQVIPGFDKAVLGMSPEESKVFTIPADEAYGSVKEELVYEVPKASIPAELKPEKGQRLVSNLEDGRQIPVTITDVTDETITLDANHPLAGQDLTFDIKIVSID
ncbi:peptidylprolyl isomerase [Salibacteraceae bacterium]|jgi:peptidylprolyl isomerase|nr:peptidylprolyl isomerase [Salibacteraceae bacterium]